MQRVIDRMHMSEITICYGMTETAPVSAQSSTSDSVEQRVGTVGRVHPHLEIKIVDEQGKVVPRGQLGELCVRGYSVMLGYWEDHEKSQEVIDSARWMHTGDIAEMDEAGFVKIKGRIKDVVIRGGENLFPKERLSYAYGTSSQPLLGMTIGEKFDQACQQYAEQDAVVSLHQNVRLTYKELQAQVNAFACSLLKLGLKKGDRLAIWSPNCVEWTITQFAAFKAGIILVNLNPAYKSNEL